MARKSLVWRGKQVTQKMREAQKEGVNQTMSACVTKAKGSHDWKNRTGVLEGGIDIIDYAASVTDGVEGIWGVRDVVYALIHETGGVIIPKSAKALAIPQAGGGVAFVQSVTIPAQPYLRPAADEQYPMLAGRIKSAYAGGAGG